MRSSKTGRPAGSEIREKRWKGVEEALDTFARWLGADGKEKLFFVGDNVSYADITVAGCLVGLKRLLGRIARNGKMSLTGTMDAGLWTHSRSMRSSLSAPMRRCTPLAAVWDC